MKEWLKISASLLTRPVVMYNELKHVRYRSWGLSAILACLWFAVEIANRQLTGFRFNTNNPETLNILIQLTLTIGVYVLYCVSNWAVCSIMSGEGRIDEIFTFTATALIPYLLCTCLSILLSNCFTLDEKDFMGWLTAIGILWSGMLLFQAMRIVHNYSSGRTIFSILLTLFTMCIVLFILFLLFALFNQIYIFINSVYSELRFRY